MPRRSVQFFDHTGTRPAKAAEIEVEDGRRI
jgi:hypothetical protein